MSFSLACGLSASVRFHSSKLFLPSLVFAIFELFRLVCCDYQILATTP